MCCLCVCVCVCVWFCVNGTVLPSTIVDEIWMMVLSITLCTSCSQCGMHQPCTSACGASSPWQPYFFTPLPGDGMCLRVAPYSFTLSLKVPYMRPVPVFSPHCPLHSPIHSARVLSTLFPRHFRRATVSISGWAASKGPHSGDLLPAAAAAAGVLARGRGQTASEQQTYSQLLPSNKKIKNKKSGTELCKEDKHVTGEICPKKCKNKSKK